MYPQGVCRIRKPACAGNVCAILPAFEAARIEKKIRYPAADDLFRGSLERGKSQMGISAFPDALPAADPEGHPLMVAGRAVFNGIE